MKLLIADVYKLIYKMSGAHRLSLGIAVAYITLLNLITICGLALLLEGWMPTKVIHKLFTFPYYFVTASFLLLINFLIMLPIRNLKKKRKQRILYIPIIIYTVISIMLYIYIQYANRIF